MEVSFQIFKKNRGGFRALLFAWDGPANKIMVFNNGNNDLNLLTAYYISFMVHVWMFIGFCWFYSQCIFSTNYHGSVYVVFLGSKMRALEWGVGYGRSWWWRYHNDVSDIILVSLLFALDMFALVIDSIANYFETVVLSSFLMQFSYVQLIICSPGLFEVFIFKFIKSEVSHN